MSVDFWYVQLIEGSLRVDTGAWILRTLSVTMKVYEQSSRLTLFQYQTCGKLQVSFSRHSKH